ncbi:MAG: BspA family leucine-rich repeat surface protein [Oscillospiraceae bacterium]|nr:BspA family leucine-rich repeat surface protein [Oscillospiraceae bacterium]
MIVKNWRKATLAAALCLGLLGCAAQKPERIAPSRSDEPILSIATTPTAQETVFTPIYATAFENTIFLASYPIEEWEGEEPECPARSVHTGGRISCGGQHEGETPITKVVILEALSPQSTRDWFRDMATLEAVQGLELLRMDNVTDMSHMFAGCALLSSLEAEAWQVPAAVDMTGIFDGCHALARKPQWYPKANDSAQLP